MSNINFEKAVEILEIIDITKIKVEDIPKLEKVAKKKWHPDKVIHSKNENLINEYQDNFKLIEVACELIFQYLQGEYKAGSKYKQSNKPEAKSTFEILKEHAPLFQTFIKKIFEKVKSENYLLEKETIIINKGRKLKEWLNEDFKDDVSMLSVVSFFYGFIFFAIIIGILGSISRILGSLIGIIWFIQALSCIIGFLPLCRLWLNENVFTIISKFINFGLKLYNWAETESNKSEASWIGIVILIIKIPVIFAYLIKYLILFPLYEISKIIWGDKQIGEVKEVVNYYANVADWYIEELINKNINEMDEDDLITLSYLNEDFMELDQDKSIYNLTNENNKTTMKQSNNITKEFIKKNNPENELKKTINYNLLHSFDLLSIVISQNREVDEVYSLDFSPDGNFLVSGGGANLIKVFDVNNLEYHSAYLGLEKLADYNAYIYTVKYSPNGSYIAFSGASKEIKLINIENNTIHSFNIFDFTRSLIFTNDSKRIISMENINLYIWDVEKGKKVFELIRNKEKIEYLGGIAYSNAEDIFAVGLNNKIQVWNLSTYKLINEFQVSDINNRIQAMVFLDDCRSIVIVGNSGEIQIYNYKNGEIIKTLKEDDNITINSIIHISDCNIIVSAGDDKKINFWDINTGKLLLSFVGHNDKIEALAISPNKRYLASGGKDAKIKIWELNIIIEEIKDKNNDTKKSSSLNMTDLIKNEISIEELLKKDLIVLNNKLK